MSIRQKTYLKIVMKEFKVNEYITLKLENGRANIYVNGERFIPCFRWFFNKSQNAIKVHDEIYSIDEVFDRHNPLQENIIKVAGGYRFITTDSEFLVYCSNLQAWVEKDYDTRLLNRFLAFPLLKKLSSIGDIKAIRVFQDEIAKRIMSGDPTATKYLVIENYLSNLKMKNLKSLLSAMSEGVKREFKRILQDQFQESFNSKNERKLDIIQTRHQLFNVLKLVLNTNELNSFEYVICKGIRIFLKDNSLKIRDIDDISQIHGLNSLKSLEKLDLSNNNIKEINNLDNLKSLKVLDLSHNKIKEIKNLENLKKLENLNLFFNEISDIQGLEQLIHLKRLFLCKNRITENKNLNTLNKLEILNLNHNKISEIKGLDNLRNLKKMNLGFNSITEIKNLENLNELEELYLTYNLISEINGLENQRKLYLLYLDSNKIKKIENLDNLDELGGLFLEDNQITELEGLSSLSSLQTLQLQNNKISEIKNLHGLKSLGYVNLEGNLLPIDHDWELDESELYRYIR